MEDDYKTRIVEEYHELKERISELDDAVIRRWESLSSTRNALAA